MRKKKRFDWREDILYKIDEWKNRLETVEWKNRLETVSFQSGIQQSSNQDTQNKTLCCKEIIGLGIGSMEWSAPRHQLAFLLSLGVETMSIYDPISTREEIEAFSTKFGIFTLIFTLLG